MEIPRYYHWLKSWFSQAFLLLVSDHGLANSITLPQIVVTISCQRTCLCERFEATSHFKSRLSLIVRVNVVLNRTVVVDSDRRLDNMCGSHLQSQREDCNPFDSEDDYSTGCRDLSRCQQKQSYWGLRSPGRSNSTYFWTCLCYVK